MPLHDTNGTTGLAWPMLATGAVAAFLLRSREIAGGGSPGSGASIALSEIAARVPGLAHAAVTICDRAFGLLFRVAAAPVQLALATLQSEFRFAFSAVAGAGSMLHAASSYLLHIF